MAYTWTVYPERSDAAMIATGITDDAVLVRNYVEAALQRAEESAWGLLVGPSGRIEVCRRARAGGFFWGPLFAPPESTTGGRE